MLEILQFAVPSPSLKGTLSLSRDEGKLKMQFVFSIQIGGLRPR